MRIPPRHAVPLAVVTVTAACRFFPSWRWALWLMVPVLLLTLRDFVQGRPFTVEERSLIYARAWSVARADTFRRVF